MSMQHTNHADFALKNLPLPCAELRQKGCVDLLTKKLKLNAKAYLNKVN